MTVLIRENRDTDRPSGRMPCDHGVRDWSDGHSHKSRNNKDFWQHQKPRRGKEGSFWSLQREHGSVDTLISDF